MFLFRRSHFSRVLAKAGGACLKSAECRTEKTYEKTIYPAGEGGQKVLENIL